MKLGPLRVLVATAVAAVPVGSAALAQTAPPFDFGDQPPPRVGDDATPEEILQAEEDAQSISRAVQVETGKNILSIISRQVSRTLALQFGLMQSDEAFQEATADPRRRQLAATGRTQLAQGGDGGGAASPWAIWTTPSYTSLETDSPSTNFDGQLITPLFGVDYMFSGGWLVGVTLGYERVDLDTEFAGRAGSYEGDGVTLVPYVGGRVAERLLLDAGLGYTHLEYDREDELASLSGSFDGERLLAFANLTGYAPSGWVAPDIQLSGKSGLLFTYEHQSAFSQVGSQDIRLGQVKAGGQAAYTFALSSGARTSSQAYVNATFNYDVIQEDVEAFGGAEPASDDRSEVVLGIGADLGLMPGLSANAEVTATLTREDFDSQTVSVGLRYSF